jgi:transcriptional regulator with XRE-family HTH domain
MNQRSIRQFRTPRPHARLTTGEVIRLRCELKGWTQQNLAKRSCINASIISLLENGRVEIDNRRAEQLAKAFEIHSDIITIRNFASQATFRT